MTLIGSELKYVLHHGALLHRQRIHIHSSPIDDKWLHIMTLTQKAQDP